MPALTLGGASSSTRGKGKKSTSNATPRGSGKTSKPVGPLPAQFAGLSVFQGLITLSNPRIGGTSQTYIFDARICFDGMEKGRPLYAVLSYFNKQKLKFYSDDSFYCFVVARLSTINPTDNLELYRVTDSGHKTTSCAGIHLIGDIDKLIYLSRRNDDEDEDGENVEPSDVADIISVKDSDDEDEGGEGDAEEMAMSEGSVWEPVVPPRPGCPTFSVNAPVVFSVSGVASNCNTTNNTFSILTEPFVSLIPRGGNTGARKARLPFEFYFSDQGRYRRSEKKPMPWDNKFVTVIGTLTHVVWGKNEKVSHLKLDVDNIVFLGSYGPDSQPHSTVIPNTLDPKAPAASRDASGSSSAVVKKEKEKEKAKAKGKAKATPTGTDPQALMTYPIAAPAASLAPSVPFSLPSVPAADSNNHITISPEMWQHFQFLNATAASRAPTQPTLPTPPSPFYIPPHQPAASPSTMQLPYSPSIAHAQGPPIQLQHSAYPTQLGTFTPPFQQLQTPTPHTPPVPHAEGQHLSTPHALLFPSSANGGQQAHGHQKQTPQLPPNSHKRQGHPTPPLTPIAPPVPPTLEHQLASQRENVRPGPFPPVQPPPGAALITIPSTVTLPKPSAQAANRSTPAPTLSMSLRSAGASNNSGSALNAPPNGHKAHGVAAPSDGGETSGLKRPMSSQGGSGKEKVLRLDGGA